MYARILELVPKLEKREEFIKVMDDEVHPFLKKHYGFLDMLLLFQIHSEKAIAISLWTERTYAEPYERECFPKVREILRPYLTTPIIVKHYVDETGLGGHFEKKHLPECISTEESACQATLNEIGSTKAIPFIAKNLKSRKRDVKNSAQLAIQAIETRERRNA